MSDQMPSFDTLFEKAMPYPPPVPVEEPAPAEGADAESADSAPRSDDPRLTAEDESGVNVEGEARANDEKAPGPTDPITRAARALPGGGGVYLLTDENDRFIMLGGAGDVRRALRTRLLEPELAEDEAVGSPVRRRANLGEIVRTIRWTTAHSAFEIDWLYWRLARALMPRDYLDQVAFGPAWFVHVDPQAATPRFAVGKVLRGGPGEEIGPFGTQAEASRFVQILEDAFDLCRYHAVLEQAPHGERCAYFDMGKCPAPCDGTVPMSDYRASIERALAFALGERKEARQAWAEAMKAAAAALEFERAGRIKQRVERAEAIEHAAFAGIGRIEGFDYLIVQRGRGRTWVKPFFVRGGVITAGEPARLKKLAEAVPGWIARMANPADRPAAKPDDPKCVSEQIWMVTHYLHRRDPPGLFLPGSTLPVGADKDGVDDLLTRIRERFEVKKTQAAEDGTAAEET